MLFGMLCFPVVFAGKGIDVCCNGSYKENTRTSRVLKIYEHFEGLLENVKDVERRF